MDFAVSPDGLRLVFTATDNQGMTSLWIHSFDAFAERPLPGTEGAYSPFWSPDSRSVGFFAARKLKTIDVSGAAPQVLCDAPSGKAGTWNAGGTIVFASNSPGPLYRVSSAGGVPQPVTPIDRSDPQIVHRSPHFLPDGRHFLYSEESANPQNGGVFVGSLDSREIRRLAAGNRPAYGQSTMLFVQNGVLMAQPFDPYRLEFGGEARRIPYADYVQNFSVSESGILAYQSGERPEPPLVIIDRENSSRL
jgi:Tol biopolymer transport system component